MKASVLSANAYLFAPTVAFTYAQMPQGSEPRAQRPWKGDGGAGGAEAPYLLAFAGPAGGGAGEGWGGAERRGDPLSPGVGGEDAGARAGGERRRRHGREAYRHAER